MELENISLENNLNTKIELEQNKFLDTTLGKAINTGIDIGIRAILPDLIEDQIIDIKNNLLKYGLKEGISKTIEEAINLGKSTLGIVTGNFDNVNQMQLAIKNGGILDSMSGLLDFVLDKVENKGIINSTVVDLLKKGKDTILNNIESNIEKNFASQIERAENLEGYMNKWKEFYKQKDFNNMEEQYKKIEKELSNLVPLESSIKQARVIENIHNLIKANGQNFNLSQTEMELVKKLT